MIGNKSKKDCFNECNNMAFNYLTTHDKPSMDIKSLLGLAPVFCVKPKRAHWSNTSRMIEILKRDIRLKD